MTPKCSDQAIKAGQERTLSFNILFIPRFSFQPNKLNVTASLGKKPEVTCAARLLSLLSIIGLHRGDNTNISCTIHFTKNIPS